MWNFYLIIVRPLHVEFLVGANTPKKAPNGSIHVPTYGTCTLLDPWFGTQSSRRVEKRRYKNGWLVPTGS